jgi:hypothetical protein
MKKIILFSLVVLMFLVACSSELPPEPGTPGSTGGGALAGQAHTFAGFAQPEGSFTLGTASFTFLEVTDSDQLGMGVVGEEFVWGTGYYSSGVDEVWTAFEFDEPRIGNSNWIAGGVQKSLLVDLNKFTLGENYVVLYACSREGSAWNCHNNQWMLQQFTVDRSCPEEYACVINTCIRSLPCPPAVPGQPAEECPTTAGACLAE